MTIDYIRRTESLTIECDYCGDSTDYNGSFPECIEHAKDDGWKILRDGFNYIHFCDDECRNEFNEKEI